MCFLQSLLTGYPGPFKTPAATLQKNAFFTLFNQGSGKVASTTHSSVSPRVCTKTSGKAVPADTSSSDSSDSDMDAEKSPAGQKTG